MKLLLTNELRLRVLDGMVSRARAASLDLVSKAKMEHEDLENATALAAYEWAYDEKTRAKLAAAKEGEYRLSHNIHFEVCSADGTTRPVNFYSANKYRLPPEPVKVIVPDTDGFIYGKCQESIASSNQYNALERSENNRMHDLEDRIGRILMGFGTVKSLTKAWPECREFLPKMLVGGKGRKQMIAEVNKEIGF